MHKSAAVEPCKPTNDGSQNISSMFSKQVGYKQVTTDKSSSGLHIDLKHRSDIPRIILQVPAV